MVDKFVIYQDIPKSHEIKIHHISCITYTNRNPNAKLSRWHTAINFNSAKSMAENLAKEDGINYRTCKKCKPNKM